MTIVSSSFTFSLDETLLCQSQHKNDTHSGVPALAAWARCVLRFSLHILSSNTERLSLAETQNSRLSLAAENFAIYSDVGNLWSL